MFSTIEEMGEEVGLDEYCFRILVLMISRSIYEYDAIRFNKLYALINSVCKMSKPTFNEHLGHLVKKRYVKRRRIAKQNVVYFLSLEHPRIEAAKERILTRTSELKNVVGKLPSLTIGEHAKLLVYLTTYQYMDRVRIIIDSILKPPKDPFKYVIASNLDQLYLDQLYGKILISCNKDKEVCERALEILEKAMDIVRKNWERFLEKAPQSE